MTEQSVKTEAFVNYLRNGGFEHITVTNFASGRLTIDFEVPRTMPWEYDNFSSVIYIADDGLYNNIVVRPPSAPHYQKQHMKQAVVAAVDAIPQYAEFEIRSLPGNEGVISPHIFFEPQSRNSTPAEIVNIITHAIDAYRQAIARDTEFDFS